MCSRTTNRVERAVTVMSGAGGAVAGEEPDPFEQAAMAAATLARRMGMLRLMCTKLIIVFNRGSQGACYVS
jgi:hypothetical protein